MSEESEDYVNQIRHNPVIRATNQMGIPIVAMLENDLIEAWRAYDAQLKKDGGVETVQNMAIRGRVRGLAQALALMQSPYTRLADGPKSKKWLKYIQSVSQSARVKSREK